MKKVAASTLFALGLTLSLPSSAGQNGFAPAGFLDWNDQLPAETPRSSPNNPESSQQTKPEEDGSPSQPTEIAINTLHPTLSPRLAALEPGQLLLQDIRVQDESPLSPDPEALADMAYHDMADNRGPVQDITGNNSVAATWNH